MGCLVSIILAVIVGAGTWGLYNNYLYEGYPAADLARVTTQKLPYDTGNFIQVESVVNTARSTKDASVALVEVKMSFDDFEKERAPQGLPYVVISQKDDRYLVINYYDIQAEKMKLLHAEQIFDSPQNAENGYWGIKSFGIDGNEIIVQREYKISPAIQKGAGAVFAVGGVIVVIILLIGFALLLEEI